MKLRRAYEPSWLLSFLPVLLLLCFMAKPLRAEEPTAKESIAEELETKEAEPSETRVYTGGWEEFTERLLLIADFDVFYTLSDRHGSNTIGGGGINGLLAPTYRLNDKNFIILMYDGQYYKKREMYSDEVGYKERTEFQAHTITPMLRMDFGERSRYSVTPCFFYTTTYNIDNESSSWSDGLYNYRDRGAGLDFDMRELFGEDGTLKLGAQYYKRRYSNYASLLSLTGLDTAAGINTERHEKDYYGVIARAGYNWIRPLGFSWQAEYSLLYKMLDDKKVVGSDGVLTSEEQEDYLHSLDLKFWHVLDVEGGLKLGLDLNGSLNNSNQNYYDGMGTWPNLKDDVPTSDFYDYDSYRITPNVSYAFALFPLTTSLSYAYQKAEYDHRRAKYSNGAHKTDKHWETQEEINLGFRYDLFEDWSLFAQWQWIDMKSNNDDERVYKYDYTVNNYSAGVSYRY